MSSTNRSSVFADLSFITLLGFAAFLGLAFASFNPADSSYFAASWPPTDKASNLVGSIGAGLASFAFFFLGCAAFLMPAATAIAATRLWQQGIKEGHTTDRDLNAPPSNPLIPAFGFFCLLVIASAALATLHADVTWRGVPMPTGGLIGKLLAAKADGLLGRAGSLLAFFLAGMASIILIANRPVFRLLTASLKQKPFAFSFGPKPDRNAAHESDLLPSGDFHMNSALNSALNSDPIEFDEDSHFAASSGTNEEPAQAGPSSHARRPSSQQPIAYNIPSTEIFDSASKHRDSSAQPPSQKDLEQTAQLLIKTFSDFGVAGKIIGFQPGPVVTVFEFQPDAGVKQSRVLGLIDDLALALKVDSIFINPVSGKRALGVQVPNSRRETVYLGDLINSDAFRASPSPLVFAMGKSLSGLPVCADLTSMPHLLMAGATGAGKSVAINSLICSVVMKSSPADVRMILVDPKMLELSVYEGIPHLLMPVITEPDRASHALKWAAAEMERRYRLMQFAAVRNIGGFNQFLDQASPARREELRIASGSEQRVERLPYILLVIDELADLMLTAPKDVETSIQRLAQKARASGIHMVLATQRPSVDIITGVIKANLPCRLSFQVVSKHDSRTILDQVGAEKLLGRGDMLFQRPGSGRLERIQGALVGDEEVLGLVATLKSSGTVAYDDSIMGWIDDGLQRERAGGEDTLSGSDSEDDPKYSEAMQIAQSHGVVSASFLQRHLKIGYNRAARIVEHMERCGLVAKADGAKPRRWLGPSA